MTGLSISIPASPHGERDRHVHWDVPTPGASPSVRSAPDDARRDGRQVVLNSSGVPQVIVPGRKSTSRGDPPRIVIGELELPPRNGLSRSMSAPRMRTANGNVATAFSSWAAGKLSDPCDDAPHDADFQPERGDLPSRCAQVHGAHVPNASPRAPASRPPQQSLQGHVQPAPTGGGPGVAR